MFNLDLDREFLKPRSRLTGHKIPRFD